MGERTTPAVNEQEAHNSGDQEAPDDRKPPGGGVSEQDDEEDEPLLSADEAIAGNWVTFPYFGYALPTARRALRMGTKLTFKYLSACPVADNQQVQAQEIQKILDETTSGRSVYISFVGPVLAKSMIGILIGTACMFFQPYANERIVQALQDHKDGKDFNESAAYMWALGSGLVGMVFASLMQHSVMLGASAARRCYAGLCTLIFQKPSIITSSAMSILPEGKVVNMMSVDCGTVLAVTVFIAFAGFALIVIVIASAMILLDLGVIGLPAIALVIMSAFANKFIGDKAQADMAVKNKASDKRIVKLNESLQGMRTVKFYAWEKVVQDKVSEDRVTEVDSMMTIAAWNSLSMFLMAALPRVAICGTILLYVHEKGSITAARAFYVSSLFDYLNVGAIVLPILVVQWSQLMESMDRIMGLLNIENDFEKRATDQLPPGEIELANASFSWGSTLEASVSDVSFKFPKGQLVAIVGEVASGKTTLAHGMLNLVRCTQGSVKVGGTTALVAQQPFVMNETVRANIVFHDTFDSARYDSAVESCSLSQDFKAMIDGDLTEVGEKGVTISGGQKQRLALARAAYSQTDVVVMDDPLSAMDAHVGMEIFQNCFRGLMKGRTRVFMTNQLQYCEMCDYIYVLKGGELVESGTQADLLQAQGEFASMMEHQVGSGSSKESEQDALQSASLEAAPVITHVEQPEKKMVQKQDQPAEKKQDDMRSSTSLMRDEQKTDDRPSPLFLAVMAKAAGSPALFALCVIVFLAAPGIEFAQNFFLARWVDDGAEDGMKSFNGAAYVFSAAAFTLVVAVGAPVYFRFFLRCSTRLHEAMLKSVLDQSIKWFDTTPVGRVINVFSGDMMQLDLVLPRMFQHFQMSVAPLLITILPACILLPAMIPFVVFLLALVFVVYRYGGDVMVELQRLYTMAQGPVLTSFSAYLQGLDTIRAFDRVDAFSDKFEDAIGKFMDASFWQAAIDRLAQGFMGGPLVSFCFMLPLCFFLIIFRVDPGISALLLFYASSFGLRLPGACFTTMMMERAFVSAQRLIEYAELPAEPLLNEGMFDPNLQNWKPTNGAIELRNVSMKYSPDLPLVLRNVNINIAPGSKVGVVGRTGAGKSSLVTAVFRMVGLEEGGSVWIDGQDVSAVPVRILRSSLGMIPQDTFMFSGTIRSNMCVDSHHTDEELWSALEQVNLKSVVESFEGQLDCEVLEKGSNLSAGTVQLVCLARVLLKRPQCIFMDEATASVDLATDTLVQQTIRKAFSKATIVTIAHRLSTVIDFDQIVVMDKGSVVEHGSPAQLLSQRDGFFSKLVDSTGQSSADELRNRVKLGAISSTSDVGISVQL